MTMEPLLLSLKIYGIVIVISMLCACVIRAIVYLLAEMGQKTPASANAGANAANAGAGAASGAIPAATAAAPSTGIPPEHVAAIAAAVYAISGAGAVVRIEDRRTRASWVSDGRFAHHASHNIVRGR